MCYKIQVYVEIKCLVTNKPTFIRRLELSEDSTDTGRAAMAREGRNSARS